MSEFGRPAGLHFQGSLREWHAAYKARKAQDSPAPENAAPAADRPVRVRISRRRREQLKQRGQRMGN